MPARKLGPEGGGLGVPHRLEKVSSVSENARPRRRVDCEIPHRLERGTMEAQRVQYLQAVDM